jgi:hypothetical protein
MLDERMHNYPEGYEEKPWCPNTKLVQICASLAGVELTPETFCTETIGNASYSDGILGWLERADFYPATSCVKVNQKLIRQLEAVKKIVGAPSDKDTTKKITEAKYLPTRLEIFRSYKKAVEEYEKRQTIINRWRNVVFETCCSTTKYEKNEHFRQFKSARELPEGEIIDKVKQFTSALNKITEYEPRFINLSCGEARNCHQSPSVHHFGRNY